MSPAPPQTVLIVGAGEFGSMTALTLAEGPYQSRPDLITVLERGAEPPAIDAASSDYNKVRSPGRLRPFPLFRCWLILLHASTPPDCPRRLRRPAVPTTRRRRHGRVAHSEVVVVLSRVRRRRRDRCQAPASRLCHQEFRPQLQERESHRRNFGTGSRDQDAVPEPSRDERFPRRHRLSVLSRAPSCRRAQKLELTQRRTNF